MAFTYLQRHTQLEMGDTYQFECQKCGRCCAHPGYFTPESLETAAEYLGIGKDDFYRRFCSADPESRTIAPKKGGDGFCVLMEKGDGVTACRIHDVKPDVCRHSPLAPLSIAIDLDTLKPVWNDETCFALFYCRGGGHGELRSVSAAVDELGLTSNVAFEVRMLELLGMELGFEKFMVLYRAINGNGQSLPTPTERDRNQMRAAVEKVYGLKSSCEEGTHVDIAV